MIIKDLTITNFKSIKHLYLNFKSINGLYEIYGNIGAGKTTLSEAILFGLFGSIKNKNNRDLIRWGEKTASIEININTKNEDLCIKRQIKGAASTIDVTLNGESLVFTNKRDIQKQLELEYYDVNKLIVESLFIISFNNFKSISNLNTRELKDFVDNVFNLNVITDYVNKCKEIIKNLYVDEITCSTNIKNIKNQIETFNKLKDEIVISDEKYDKLKVKKTELDTNLIKYNKLKENKLKQIQDKAYLVKGNIQVNKSKITELTKQIEFIKKEFCPTCGAKIDASKLPEYQEKLNILKTENDDNNIKLKQFVDEYNNTKLKIDKKIQELTDEYNKITKAIHEFDMHKKQTKIYESTIEKIENELQINIDNQKDVLKNISLYKELQDLLNSSVRSSIISNIIPIVNENLMYFSSKLNLNYSIKFNEEFTCEISNNDCENIQIHNLSTGQNKTIDMIIILSILKVLINGFNMNILFLDELFSNLDDNTRRTMCLLLKEETAKSQCIFIISHSELPNELLDGRLLVERDLDNNESTYIIE